MSDQAYRSAKTAICAECRYSVLTNIARRAVEDGFDADARDYRCNAIAPVVVSPPSRDHVTGQAIDPILRWTRCIDQNSDGQCNLFEAKPAPEPERETAMLPARAVEVRKRGPLRRFAAWLGARLTDWGDRS